VGGRKGEWKGGWKGGGRGIEEGWKKVEEGKGGGRREEGGGKSKTFAEPESLSSSLEPSSASPSSASPSSFDLADPWDLRSNRGFFRFFFSSS
jgi:hypothetical protein